jgi:hypothetical protein
VRDQASAHRPWKTASAANSQGWKPDSTTGVKLPNRSERSPAQNGKTSAAASAEAAARPALARTASSRVAATSSAKASSASRPTWSRKPGQTSTPVASSAPQARLGPRSRRAEPTDCQRAHRQSAEPSRSAESRSTAAWWSTKESCEYQTWIGSTHSTSPATQPAAAPKARRAARKIAATPSAPSTGGTQIAIRSTSEAWAPGASARTRAATARSKSGPQIGRPPSGKFR